MPEDLCEVNINRLNVQIARNARPIHSRIKLSVIPKIKKFLYNTLQMEERPGNLIGKSDSEDFHPKLALLTSEAFMIVLRLLCDGILKGWNQDPAHTFHSWGALEKSAFPSSLN
ncbi:hypothetical protein [Phormidesmis priestleyi]